MNAIKNLLGANAGKEEPGDQLVGGNPSTNNDLSGSNLTSRYGMNENVAQPGDGTDTVVGDKYSGTSASMMPGNNYSGEEGYTGSALNIVPGSGKSNTSGSLGRTGDVVESAGGVDALKAGGQVGVIGGGQSTQQGFGGSGDHGIGGTLHDSTGTTGTSSYGSGQDSTLIDNPGATGNSYRSTTGNTYDSNVTDNTGSGNIGSGVTGNTYGSGMTGTTGTTYDSGMTGSGSDSSYNPGTSGPQGDNVQFTGGAGGFDGQGEGYSDGAMGAPMGTGLRAAGQQGQGTYAETGQGVDQAAYDGTTGSGNL